MPSDLPRFYLFSLDPVNRLGFNETIHVLKLSLLTLPTICVSDTQFLDGVGLRMLVSGYNERVLRDFKARNR